MANSTKNGLFLLALLIAFVGYAGYKIWKRFEKAAEISCLASITNPAAKALQIGQIQLNGRSRELSKEEINALIKQGKIGDCGGKEYVYENLPIAIGEANQKAQIESKFGQTATTEFRERLMT